MHFNKYLGGVFMSKFIKIIMMFLITLSSPILVFAEEVEEVEEETATMNPLVAIIVLIVWVVVTYLVYQLMYSGTILIGTKQGIANGIGRRLAIPIIVGAFAAWGVWKALDFIIGLIKIVFLIAIILLAIVVIIAVVSKLLSTNKQDDINNSNETPDSDNTQSEEESLHQAGNSSEPDANDAQRFCPECGSPYQLGSLMCSNCGAKFDNEKEFYTHENKQNNTKIVSNKKGNNSKIAIGICAIVGVLLLVGIIIGTSNKKGSAKNTDLYEMRNMTENEVAKAFGVPINEYKIYPSEDYGYVWFTTDNEISITMSDAAKDINNYSFCGVKIGDEYDVLLDKTKDLFIPITWYKNYFKDKHAFKEKKNPRGLLFVELEGNKISAIGYMQSDENIQITEEDPYEKSNAKIVENDPEEKPEKTVENKEKTDTEYSNDEEPTDNTNIDVSYEEIVEKARIYSGAPLAELDNVAEDNCLNIHLYEDMGDHIATWDWYHIDPNTLKGTNFNDEPVDLNNVDISSEKTPDENNNNSNDEEFIFVVTAPDGYVNVRTGPGTEYAIIEPVSNGELLYAIDRIEYTDTGKAWLKIKGYDEGWVSDTQVTYITDGYILPGSDSSYYDESQLKRLSKEGLRYARNEIYARHGKEFKDEGLRKYFQSREWYHPTGAEVPDSAFNEYEIYNRDLIQSLEK